MMTTENGNAGKSDLVERLRKLAHIHCSWGSNPVDYVEWEAAEAIEARDAAITVLEGELDHLKAVNTELVAALQNIENDDEHMPPSAWAMIQNAIKLATEGDSHELNRLKAAERVVEAARARFKSWTRETYDELQAALEAYDDAKK